MRPQARLNKFLAGRLPEQYFFTFATLKTGREKFRHANA